MFGAEFGHEQANILTSRRRHNPRQGSCVPKRIRQMKLSPTAFCVAAFVVFSTVAAVAAPATTRRSTPLYDGPSNNFDVITVIRADTDVEVTGCSRGWCYVWLDDDEGFVRERLLDFYDESPPIVVFPPALYQYGWSYWRQHNYEDWGRWHNRYRRDTRPPPRRDDRQLPPQVYQPDRRGPPAPSSPGAPARDPRDFPSPGSGDAPSLPPPPGPPPGAPPGGGPPPPPR